MSRQLMTLIALIALWLFLVASCSPSLEPSAQLTTTPERSGGVTLGAAQPTSAPRTADSTYYNVKLGIMVPLTGATAQTGISNERFIRMALDEVNAKGLTVGDKQYRLEAVTVDDKFNPDDAREAANRLIQAEKVRFILGSPSASTVAAQTVTEANKALLLALNAQDQSLGANHPLTFQIGLPHQRMRVNALYELLAKEHPELKRLAILTADEPGQRAAVASEEAAKAHGISVVGKEILPNDIRDLQPSLHRVLRQNPDAVEISGSGMAPLFVPLARTLDDEGFRKPLFGIAPDFSAIAEVAALVEGYTTTGIADRGAAIIGSGERALIRRYIQKYGERDLELLPLGIYNAPLILAQAMAKAGTVEDAEKIAEVLREGQWDTIWADQWGKAAFVGAVTFGAKQILEQPVYLSRVQAGKLVTFQVTMGALP